jgi:NAD-dependent dihydropyrimidine dehydrogenase PreA subunit
MEAEIMDKSCENCMATRLNQAHTDTVFACSKCLPNYTQWVHKDTCYLCNNIVLDEMPHIELPNGKVRVHMECALAYRAITGGI